MYDTSPDHIHVALFVRYCKS